MTLSTKHADECAGNFGGECDCFQSNLPTAFNIRDALFKYTNCAFEYEDEFLATFCKDMKAADLLECYMASDRCKIIFVLDSGTTISNTVSTTKFMSWCEDKFNNGSIAGL